jgi:hypothetical protein
MPTNTGMWKWFPSLEELQAALSELRPGCEIIDRAIIAGGIRIGTVEEKNGMYRLASKLTVELITEAAAKVKRMIDSGTAWPTGRSDKDLWELLYRVAYGVTKPEVLVKFIAQSRLCKRISRLSLEEQQKLIDDEPIRVVMEDLTTVKLIRAQDLTPRQISQVFGPARRDRSG